MSSFPLLLFLVIPHLVIAQVPGGLTYETCRSDLGCTSPRTCIDSSTFRPCKPSPTESVCLCVPPSFTPCTTSETCIQGEVCARSDLFPFVCTSAIVAVPPSGPFTAEEAAVTPLGPSCPQSKSANRNFLPSYLPIRMRDPPSPDAPPSIPPELPPDAPPGAPVPGGAIPGSPGPPPPGVSDPQPNALSLQICRPGTCAKGLSCVTVIRAASAGPPSDGPRNRLQRFRCCVDADPLCLCHPKDTRPVCLSNADCNTGELCAKTPINPPTCTSLEELQRMTKSQRRQVIILKGKRPGKPGKPVPLVERPKPSPDVPEETLQDTPEPTITPEATTKPVLERETPSPSPVGTALSPTPDSVNEPTPEAAVQDVEGICVDVDALRHLDRADLVFEHDRHARVLCDVDGSCATAGHMVWFNGRVMMMKSYCNMAGCEEKVIKVNSPRYRRGMTVKSRTKGLGYTSLAARYGTKVEEGLLAGIVHMGL